MATARIIAVFFILWLVLDRAAAFTGSMRGEAGLFVCALVVALAIAAECFVFRRTVRQAVADLGFRTPTRPGVLVAAAMAVAMIGFFPAYALAAGTPMALRADWLWLIPGLFAQAGIAEEVVFRGFLFRHFRAGRSFWRAAGLSAIPFVLVHMLLFATLDFGIALASIVVATSVSFPLARLFEVSGNAVWGAAVVHFLIQGLIKIVEVPEAAFLPLAIAWMVFSAIVPWAVFAIRRAPQ